MRASLISWFALVALAAAAPAFGIALGQLDDFQDGTIQSWVAVWAEHADNIPNGGPDGTVALCAEFPCRSACAGTRRPTRRPGDSPGGPIVIMSEIPGRMALHLRLLAGVVAGVPLRLRLRVRVGDHAGRGRRLPGWNARILGRRVRHPAHRRPPTSRAAAPTSRPVRPLSPDQRVEQPPRDQQHRPSMDRRLPRSPGREDPRSI